MFGTFDDAVEAKVFFGSTEETKMNIRISSHELDKIKAIAEKEGLKYQTFIKSILHKYITGQLVEEYQESIINISKR